MYNTGILPPGPYLLHGLQFGLERLLLLLVLSVLVEVGLVLQAVEAVGAVVAHRVVAADSAAFQIVSQQDVILQEDQ